MTTGDGEELRGQVLARLEKLAAEIAERRALLGQGPYGHSETVRLEATTAALVALGCVRDLMALVVPGLDSYAADLVGQAIANFAPSAPDDAEALDELRTTAGRLLADVFVAGQLNAAVHPDSWPLTPLVRPGKRS